MELDMKPRDCNDYYGQNRKNVENMCVCVRDCVRLTFCKEFFINLVKLLGMRILESNVLFVLYSMGNIVHWKLASHLENSMI